MPLYVDIVMLLNFLTDLLLLMGTNRLSGFPFSWHLPAAAFLGSIYSGLCLFPELSFLGRPVWHFIFLCLISLTAFGLQESALRRGALFLLLSLALGGMALAIQLAKPVVLILEALALWLLTRLSFGTAAIGDIFIPITVQKGRESVHFTALLDTGNQLRDPITGEAVTVIAPAQARQLTGLTQEQLNAPMETMVQSTLAGLRLIPYSAVGQKGSMLLAMRFPSVTIGKHTGPALLAFAPEGFTDCGSYQALTGGGYSC